MPTALEGQTRLLPTILDDEGNEVQGFLQSYLVWTRLSFLLWVDLEPGTYHIRIKSDPDDTYDAAATGKYAIFTRISLKQTYQRSLCSGLNSVQSDPFYGCQWHLNNTGQFGGARQDINVEEVWATNQGAGVTCFSR